MKLQAAAITYVHYIHTVALSFTLSLVAIFFLGMALVVTKPRSALVSLLFGVAYNVMLLQSRRLRMSALPVYQ